MRQYDCSIQFPVQTVPLIIYAEAREYGTREPLDAGAVRLVDCCYDRHRW
jgi:hypothetical protein